MTSSRPDTPTGGDPHPLPGDGADVLSGRGRRVLGAALAALAGGLGLAAWLAPEALPRAAAAFGAVVGAAGLALASRKLPAFLAGGGGAGGPFRVMADAVPVLLWAAGPDGRLTLVNRPWVEFTGRKPRGGAADGLAEVVHPDDRNRCRALFAVGRIDREAVRGEFRLRRADGEYRWVAVRGRPVFGPGDAFRGFMAAAVDVTDDRHARESLAASELRLRVFLSHAPVVLFAFDAAGVITRAEGKGLEAVGLRPDDLLGRTDADLYPDAPEIQGYAARALAGAEVAAEITHGPAVFDVRYAPRLGPGGKVVEVIGVATDVTARVRAEQATREQTALLASLIDAAPDGILVVGPDGTWRTVNRRFNEMWGFPPDVGPAADEASRLAATADRVANPIAFRAGVKAIYADPHAVTTDEVKLADGRTFDRFSGPVRGPDGAYLGRVWYFRDVSDRRAAEGERRAGAEALGRARDEAEAADRAKSQFLANMSHEVRTPTAAVVGYAEMLLDPRLGADARTAAVWAIRLNGEHLLTVISDVLDLSKIEAGELEVERVGCAPCRVAAEAVVAATGSAFGLVFMDVQMPELDGFAAAGELGRAGYTGPVVALTAHSMAGDEEKCLRAGCTAYPTKPVDPDRLIATAARPDARRTPAPPNNGDAPSPLDALMAAFWRALPQRAGELSAALHAGDVARVAALAHRLRGSAGMHGLPAVSETAGRLEEACRIGQDTALLGELVGEIEALADKAAG